MMSEKDTSFEQKVERFLNMVDNQFEQILSEGESDSGANWSTPEEYRAATGKRFRMTKEQKERNITRDQAFEEFKNKFNKVED